MYVYSLANGGKMNIQLTTTQVQKGHLYSYPDSNDFLAFILFHHLCWHF